MNTADLVYWMRERQAVYRRRLAGRSAPWSTDPIFNDYRFCNVFRELDRVTIWLRRAWREPYAEHKMLPFAMAMARSINLPETLEELGFPKTWRRDKFVAAMTARRARGNKLVTSAHLVHGGKGVGGVHMRIAQTLDDLYAAHGASGFVRGTLEETAATLTTIGGIGVFTSYEITTDLRHTTWLNGAPDIMSWCSIGPGSRRGLNRVMGRPLTAKGPAEVSEISELLRSATRDLRRADPMFARLEMRDIEHSLCELDKYLRIRDGAGVGGGRFKPRGLLDG